jgi:hypothetical protein
VAQIFPRWTNDLPLYLAIGGALVAVLLVGGVWYYFSPEYTDVGYQPAQPVDYSHKLHAGDLGINCLYCHATVDRAPAAVVPPTKTCMNCHHLVKRDSPMLAVVRDSAANGRRIEWTRVHDLPGYAYFDHRPHLRAAVGCSTCHGRIDQMEKVTLEKPLSMSWCLDCHRDPDPYLRDEDDVTLMDWTPPNNQLELAAAIRQEKQIRPPLDCSGCHR